MSTPLYTYKGFQYVPWDDVEPDNIKIWHDVITPEDATITVDWSPYMTMSRRDFERWIDFGMPERLYNYPLRTEDLDSIQDLEELYADLPPLLE